MFIIVYTFDLLGVFIAMEGSLVYHFLSDFFGFKDFLFKLALSFNLQEANVVDIPHTIHYLLQPRLIFTRNLIKVRILMRSRIILVDNSQIIL